MADRIISRKDAQAQGLKRYFTGKPCKHGHTAERFVIGRKCVECSQASCRRQYAKDPQKAVERVRAYYAEHVEERAAYSKRKREENIEEARAYGREKSAEWNAK